MNWVEGTLYSRVKCLRGQDTVPTVSCPCPEGQDKPGGGGGGAFYPGVKCPWGQDTWGTK